MHTLRAIQTAMLTATLAISPAFASHAHRSPTSGHAHAVSKKKAKVHQVKGQRGIDTNRAREIQTALIREHYLTGEPSGAWDQQTQQAMVQYQADHNWQTKLTPDSRALISLGLGPNGDTTNPIAAAAAPIAPAAVASKAAPAQPTRSKSSNAVTLADAHSILN